MAWLSVLGWKRGASPIVRGGVLAPLGSEYSRDDHKEVAMQATEAHRVANNHDTARVGGTHRPQVVGIQRRSPRGDATESWSNFDHHCAIDRVSVHVHGGRVELFLQ